MWCFCSFCADEAGLPICQAGLTDDFLGETSKLASVSSSVSSVHVLQVLLESKMKHIA